jgi:uncharacterized protein YhaN
MDAVDGEIASLQDEEARLVRERDRRIEALSSLSRNRQLFIFTCHPELAAQFSQCGGTVLKLER